MRDAERTLAIIRDRGSRGLPLEDVYRQLYNPDLYLRAYGRIYRNDGAMTRGVTAMIMSICELSFVGTLNKLPRIGIKPRIGKPVRRSL